MGAHAHRTRGGAGMYMFFPPGTGPPAHPTSRCGAFGGSHGFGGSSSRGGGGVQPQHSFYGTHEVGVLVWENWAHYAWEQHSGGSQQSEW